MSNWKFLLVASSLSFLFGCGDESVDIVKNGVMNGYDFTTVGKAFDFAFDDPTWDSYEGDRGEKIVRFEGEITEKNQEDIFNSRKYIRTLDIPSWRALYASAMSEDGFLEEIAEKYSCSPGFWHRGKLDLNCITSKNKDMFTDDTYRYIIKKTVPVGAKIRFEWIVYPDNKFDAISASSPSFEASIKSIVDLVYGSRVYIPLGDQQNLLSSEEAELYMDKLEEIYPYFKN